MSATPVNILRYSVLGLGVVYGFYHQRTITSTQKAAAAQRDYEHKQQLINKAKEAYARSKQPAASASGSSSGLNQDLNSPNLDLEALLEGFLNQK
ncbi:ATP synthase E chain-domain-containing protein [Chaetomium sp. MPI-SDFR-AT-0129]|uniref:ATP synthase F(0) complex subunit e, mitochondrial n=1 Tax=Dichotomopilus funicola TaxID=1934379 RepID=A0AAN6VAL2_9PEZI|nr:ATP synthase E chain-domain-containing protein [Chaetomium sp. MPI-SDFR-AT-0129]KAK4147887.1 ATP synthase E chain-domain-containing protein [Dichotomopilus funicola]